MERSLANKRVLITGVGVKPVAHVFRDISTGEPSHTAITSGGKEYKANIGAATALECARAGAWVHLAARTPSSLSTVKDWIEANVSDAHVECTATDLNDIEQVQRLCDSLPQDLTLYWVQSVGLGGGTLDIKNDNPYLPIDELTENLLTAELSVLTCTMNLLRTLLPRLRSQIESRICIVSSMSAVRSFPSGSAHSAAKGAISRFTNAATIELDKDGIFITDIRPGIVDTGMYDSAQVQEVAISVGKSFGHDYSSTNIYCMPPSAVGQVIVNALTSPAHITSVNMVARGQWPHESS